jgi:peptidoglycan-associated lipoprotein
MATLARSVPSARVLVLFAVAAASLAACRKKPAPAPAPTTTTTTVNQDSINAARAREDSIRRARERQQFVDDSIARARGDRDRLLAAARAALTAPVYFDYDMAEIRSDARSTLESKLPVLTANPTVRLRIAGHTDSRGSDEYNLALGQRRAASVKAFFTERGIDAGRLEIVSFGRERPTCSEEEESCWSRNRRAEFEVTAGGDNIALPNGSR